MSITTAPPTTTTTTRRRNLVADYYWRRQQPIRTSTDDGNQPQQRRLMEGKAQPRLLVEQPAPERQRLLYIMTSIAEYDNGRRATTKGYDRFTNTLIPVLHKSISSMLNSGYNVDVYLILHYNITGTKRQQQLQDLFQSIMRHHNIEWEYWENATPMGYETEHSQVQISEHKRGLSRQHRYVIKDKIWYYDVFVNYEDDMLIGGKQIIQYQNLTQQLYESRQVATPKLPYKMSIKQAKQLYYGPMTNLQLARIIPGFMRVEVGLPDYEPPPSKPIVDNNGIPVDFHWNNNDSGTKTTHSSGINPSICCQIMPSSSSITGRMDQQRRLPEQYPKPNELYLWETSIDGLGVRLLPNNKDWVVLLGGHNNDEGWDDPNYVIGDYWSGGNNVDDDTADTASSQRRRQRQRPDLKEGKYANNQGGWMSTRRQLVEWHTRWCRGSFLPPYDPPFFPEDGLDGRSVEYWSGGIQLFGVNGCRLQRIVPLEPNAFSYHLLYHTSNNKQRQRFVKHLFHSANDFWGQLNTVRKRALQHLRQKASSAQPPPKPGKHKKRARGQKNPTNKKITNK